MAILDSVPGGIVAIQLDGHGGMHELDPDALPAATPPVEGALWVHLDYNDPQAAAYLEGASGLSADIAQALCAEVSRPRRVSTANGLLAVLRAVNLNAEASPEDMVSVRIWVEDRRIITARGRGLQSVVFVRDTLARGEGPHTAPGVFCSLFERITDLTSDVVAELGERIGTLEDSADAGEFDLLASELPAARRQVIALRRHLAPQRDAMQRLLLDQDPRLAEGHTRRLREATDLLVRQVEELDAMRERVGVVQDQVAAHHSRALERRTYALTVLAALFVPLGFLTGLLGINVGGMPGADDPAAFGIVVLLCLLFAVAGYLVLRYRRWL